MTASPAAELEAALAEYVPEVMALTGTPGIVMAVAWRGETIVEAAYGVADLASKAPMTSRTAARVASITKWYTAVAAMQLAGEGHLDIGAPLAEVANPLGSRAVTAYDLLTHRSGLATDTPAGSLDRPPTLEDLIEQTVRRNRRWQYRDDRPCWTAPVGARFQYSNLGMALLGLAVERLNPDHLSFPEYVRERILAPLGMRDSIVAASTSASSVPVCSGYARFADTLVPTPVIHSAAPPADGLIATPADHVRLVGAFLADGRGLIDRSLLRRMLRPHIRQHDVATEDGAWYGLGLEMGSLRSRSRWFGHSGAYPFGWWSDSRGYPEHDLAVVVCTNKWDMVRWYNPAATIAPGLIAEFVRAWLDRPVRSRGTWPWRRAYAAGMLMADRVTGLVAPQRRLGAAEANAIARETRDVHGRTMLGGWDRDGFVAGVTALSNERLTPAGVRAFLSSERCPVMACESQALALSLGGRGGLPIPAPYWSAHSAVSQIEASRTSSEAASTTDAQLKKP